MLSRRLDVAQRAGPLDLDLLRAQRAQFAGGHPHRKHSATDPRPRSHHGASGNQGVLADLGPVEHDRSDPDQRAIAHPAAMNDSAVAHRDFIAEDRRKAIGGDMESCLVLDIRTLADANSLDVAAQNRPIEDARVDADLDVAYHGGTGSNPDTLV